MSSVATELTTWFNRIERINKVERVVVEDGPVDVDTVANELGVDNSTARRWIDEARADGRVEIDGVINGKGGIEDEYLYRIPYPNETNTDTG